MNLLKKTTFQYLLVCVPAFIILLFINKFAVNVPSWDEFANVDFFRIVSEQGIDFGKAFGFHNEHRLFFPRLVWLPLWKISSFNCVFVMLFQQIFPLAAVCFLFHIFRERGKTSVWLFLPAAALWFTLTQKDNMLSAFQLAFVMCQAFPVFAFCFMHLAINKEKHHKLFFCLSCVCAVIASFSSAHGLFGWFGLIVGLILVLIKSLRIKENRKWDIECSYLVITILLAVFSWVIYFHGSTYLTGVNHLGKSGLSYIIQHLGRTLNYALLLIGNSLATSDGNRQILAMLLIALSVYLLIALFKRDDLKNFFVYIALVAFTYGAIAGFVYGRVELGDYNASRYVTTTILLPIGLYLALVKMVESGGGYKTSAANPVGICTDLRICVGFNTRSYFRRG